MSPKPQHRTLEGWATTCVSLRDSVNTFGLRPKPHADFQCLFSAELGIVLGPSCSMDYKRRRKNISRSNSNSTARTRQERSWPNLSITDLPRSGNLPFGRPCGLGNKQSKPIFPHGILERKNSSLKRVFQGKNPKGACQGQRRALICLSN